MVTDLTGPPQSKYYLVEVKHTKHCSDTDVVVACYSMLRWWKWIRLDQISAAGIYKHCGHSIRHSYLVCPPRRCKTRKNLLICCCIVCVDHPSSVVKGCCPQDSAHRMLLTGLFWLVDYSQSSSDTEVFKTPAVLLCLIHSHQHNIH